MTDWVDPAEHDALLEPIPMREAGHVEHVATVMCLLISPDAACVTGAIWAADGGVTAV